MIRIMIFGASWLIKIIAQITLALMKSKCKVAKSLAYFVSVSQKLHMVALNSVAIDLIPYSIITLFHTREFPLLTTWSSAILLALLVYDYCEIWSKGGKSRISELRTNESDATSSLVHLREERKTIVIQKDLEEKTDANRQEIDHPATLLKLEQNMTIVGFCTNDLHQKSLYSGD